MEGDIGSSWVYLNIAQISPKPRKFNKNLNDESKTYATCTPYVKIQFKHCI